jgi:hypothetical protein
MDTETNKKRGSYTTKKKLELENLLAAAKEFQFVSKKEDKPIKRNPASIAELTQDSCLYPARFLNNDSTCIKCDIYEHCACAIKNLGRKKKNE